jgi:hypothetical protein
MGIRIPANVRLGAVIGDEHTAVRARCCGGTSSTTYGPDALIGTTFQHAP